MSHRSRWTAGLVTATLTLSGLAQLGLAAPASAAPESSGPCSYDGVGSVSLEGSPTVGDPVTATVTGNDGRARYAWSGTGFGEPVHGPTLTARPDVVGAPVRLTVQVRNGGGRSFTATCDLDRVAWGHLARPSAPEVAGTPVLGGTLHASPGAAGDLPAGARVHYEWFLGDSPSAFTTGDELELRRGHVGSTITVKTMVTAPGRRDSAWSTATVTAPVAAGTLAQPGAPSISGDATMAGVLVAAPAAGDDVPDDATYEFRWLADGEQFATGGQVTLGAGQVGRTITVQDRASATGYAASAWSASSAATASVTPGVLEKPSAVAVTGTPTVGSTLTAVVTGGWTPGTQAVFAWKADGTTFSTTPGAVTLTSAQVGRMISVEIVGTLAGYVSGSVASAAVGPVDGALLPGVPGRPTISGTPTVGQVLSASPAPGDPAWPDGATYRYEWSAGGVPFATGPSVTLQSGQVGHAVTVRTSVRAVGYVDSAWSTASAATSPVSAGDVTAPSKVTVTGTPKVGRTLTATATGSWMPGTRVTYVWRADGRVFGRSSATAVLTGRELGKRITVTLTGTLAGHQPASVTSAATAKVGAGTLTAPRPTVQGKAKVGRTLTVRPGAWTPGTRLTYRWFANGRLVKGATSAHLRLTKGLKRQRITVTVTGRQTGYVTVTRSSRPTSRVAP